MSKKISRLWRIVLLLLLFSPVATIAEESPKLEFRASDKSFTMSTVDDFRVSYNPHAVLSLASLDEVVVVVTKRKAEQTIDKIYDLFPKSLPADYPCQGRVMMTIDGEQAAVFVVDGMFPPGGDPTHQTLLGITVHDGQEYNFMIHYPLENKDKGMEQAYEMLATVKWSPTPAPNPSPEEKPEPTEPKS